MQDAYNSPARARHSATIYAVLGLIGSSLTAWGWYSSVHMTRWQWNYTAVLCLAVLLILVAYRSVPLWASNLFLLLTIGANLSANVLTNYELASARVQFELFGAFKVVPIIIAVVIPAPVWVGYFVIMICFISVPVLYYFVFPADMSIHQSGQEPWNILMYSIIGFALLRYRLKAIAMERDLANVKADQIAISRIARVVLGLRDLMNTPLQSIELTSQLLKSDSISPQEGSEYLEKSLVRLRELNDVLSTQEDELAWTRSETSFEAVSLIQKEISGLRQPSKG